MSVTISPNMSLIIPTVGVELGPNWANDLNSSLSIIDQHNHTPGSGVQITPAAININSALSFQNNFATNVAGTTFSAQTSTPANGTIYMVGADLYFNNGSGLDIQLTNSSGIVGTTGTISGISGTASASYSSPTFFWRSATGIAANMDMAAAIMRNISPNSTYALTLQPPAALASNFSLTLPTIPGATSFLQIDTSGNFGAGPAISSGITASNIAANTITFAQIASQGIHPGNLQGNFNLNGKACQEENLNLVVSNTNATNSIAIIRAITNSSGTVVVGEGITTSTFSGSMTITFSTAFSDSPVVVACSASSSNIGALYVPEATIGTSSAIIQGFINSDYSANIIVMAQRA